MLGLEKTGGLILLHLQYVLFVVNICRNASKLSRRTYRHYLV